MLYRFAIRTNKRKKIILKLINPKINHNNSLKIQTPKQTTIQLYIYIYIFGIYI